MGSTAVVSGTLTRMNESLIVCSFVLTIPWRSCMLHQMQPETKPTFSSEGGVYELCSDGDSSVFSYHSSDMSVRQWSARDMQQQRTIGTMSASEPEGENPVPVGLCVISKSSSSGDSDSSTSCSSRQLYLCAVARYSILSNTASHVVVLDVPREAGDHHVAGSKFALKFNPGKEPRVCAGLQHELYLAGLKVHSSSSLHTNKTNNGADAQVGCCRAQ